MRKSAVIVMVLIIFNVVLLWFSAMGFFNYSPEGTEVESTGGVLGFTGTSIWGYTLLITSVALIGGAISRVTGINMVKMILYMEIFWVPYVTTMGTFNIVFNSSPESFLGFASIFSLIMIFVFAYDLYEMSGLEYVN